MRFLLISKTVTMKFLSLVLLVFFMLSCGSGDVGESYNTTDSSDLNNNANNELNNITPVNDDSIGGIIEQQYVVDSNSLNSILDSTSPE